VVAAIREIETEQQVESIAVERADRKGVGRKFKDVLVLFERRVDVVTVHMSRTNTPWLDAAPAIGTLVLILFEHEIPLIAAIEIPHRGVFLLHLLEEMQHGLAVLREVHLGAEIHVDVEIVAIRAVTREPRQGACVLVPLEIPSLGPEGAATGTLVALQHPCRPGRERAGSRNSLRYRATSERSPP